MPVERRLVQVLGCAALMGCAVDIGDGYEPAPPPAAAAPPALGACDLLSTLDGLEGRVVPAALPDGRQLLLAAHPDFEGTRESAAFETETPCGAHAAALPARPIIDVSPLAEERVGSVRSAFTTADSAYLYFSLDRAGGFESDGTGIARFDEAAGAFLAQALLWTSDRPSYGAAAVVADDYVYVYGGLPARFLAADVYLARAPLARVAEPAAYEYWQGGGEWATDPDLAGPLLEAGTMPSVIWHPPTERYLMAYVTPLAREISLRSGLGPAGPWSRPLSWGACALPFEQAFCGDVAFLPAFAGKRELALSQAVVAFDAPATVGPADYWTQLVRGSVPASLP